MKREIHCLHVLKLSVFPCLRQGNIPKIIEEYVPVTLGVSVFPREMFVTSKGNGLGNELTMRLGMAIRKSKVLPDSRQWRVACLFVCGPDLRVGILLL